MSTAPETAPAKADFLLELRSEEIPARMQAKASDDLVKRIGDGLGAAALDFAGIDGFVTPRRLIVHVRGLAASGATVSEERRGPRADAPPAAIEGFLRSTGLARDAMEERDTPKGRFLYATITQPGRDAATILAELIPAIVAKFDWPKSMRWGEASVSPASIRWVRPLSGIVALLGDRVVPFDIADLSSGRTTRGHRFMAEGEIEIADAASYAGQLRAARVMIDAAERRTVIVDGARAATTEAGLTLIEDDGLVAENAGLTEWPVPLLGRFDPAFLDVPREVIQLTMRTNQKYFAATDAGGALAPVFVCVANLVAADGGAGIIDGNRKVLAARLSDAKFFWDQDRATTLEARLPKLANIVFHEKLGTVADKVERVAKLARWLVTSGAINPPRNGEDIAALADLAEQAARLCKADLVSATVGEFPEVQGIAGGYLALAEGLDPQVAAAIRDHYKPVGQGDDVPTAPVTVAVALADKLDSLVAFFVGDDRPTGSRDPYALRRAALGFIALQVAAGLKLSLASAINSHTGRVLLTLSGVPLAVREKFAAVSDRWTDDERESIYINELVEFVRPKFWSPQVAVASALVEFLTDRLKVQQREAGVRHDLIDAVVALGNEDDLVRLLARVNALQAFLVTDDGANLLAAYKRAANILAIETKKDGGTAYDEAIADDGRLAAADLNLNRHLVPVAAAAEAAVAAEDFAGAMGALAQLRAPIDDFFAAVMVNDPDADVRRARLTLLQRFRDSVHAVADFSKIEG